ncbi:MAG: peptidyl-prolyl cis-trans isomerase [Nitrospirae bacterium]|nr:peptidyl-prolyl cis-trans isomerase [Nitrospirota bacterium]
MLLLRQLLISSSLTVILFAGCTTHGPGKDRSQEALAWVNDQPILKQRLIHEVAQAGFRSPDEIEKILRNQAYVNQVIANLITEELLYQEAVRRSIRPTPTMPQLAAQADASKAARPNGNSPPTQAKGKKRAPKGEEDEVNMRRRLIAALVEQAVDPKILVSDGEIYANYTEHLDEFRRPGTVRARQILVSTREEALEILQTLKSGMDFASVARERSISPDAETGGDLGYFSADETQPEIARACFDLPVGGISREVESPYGFHLFQVVDKVPPRTLPLDEVRESITTRLRKQKRETIYRNWLSDLRKKAKITLK